ncbi:MAG TPA: MBL fold metallo-hydrolase, partial [Spirochaetia bacterium]|nr:MBL fold metallo-hydrolase [Spirochaetia bacterium]
MTLTILGSGASEGIPAFLCNCTGCRRARQLRGREIRQNACALVTSRTGQSLLIDMPPQIKMAWDARHFDHESLLGVLVTHRHEDHTLGLKYLRDVDPRNGVRDAHAIQLWLPEEVQQSWFPPGPRTPEAAAGSLQESAIDVLVVESAREFSLGPFRVTPVETWHLRAAAVGDLRGSSFGYMIEDADGKRLAYMVDSPAQLPEKTFELLSARRLDCLVFECTFSRGQSPDQHTDLEGLRAVHQSLHPRLMIATHF